MFLFFNPIFLVQAPCQVELENWVNSIHSACAAAFARHRGKTGTLHLLQVQIWFTFSRYKYGLPSLGIDMVHLLQVQIRFTFSRYRYGSPSLGRYGLPSLGIKTLFCQVVKFISSFEHTPPFLQLLWTSGTKLNELALERRAIFSRFKSRIQNS